MASSFDVYGELDALLVGAGLSVIDTGGTITVNGRDPVMPSVHRLATAAGLAMLAGAVGSAAMWQLRTGRSQHLEVDLREAVHGINPSLGFGPTLNGHPYPRDEDGPHPVPHQPQRLSDGRWGVLCAHFQHTVYEWLNLLGCPPERRAVESAIARWAGPALEEAAAAAKLPFSLCETTESFAKRAQGTVLSQTPTIELTRIGDSEAVTPNGGVRPLTGVRVLQLTHAISGPVVGRTMAEQGADVLQLASPRQIELDPVYNDACVGGRSAFADLKSASGHQLAMELLQHADVLVENFRGGVADRLGFGPDELATIRPGIVVVSVRCYGYRGPWWDRGGHDMMGSAASGVMVSEGSDDQPRFPPTFMLNDYLTGYLGAAGAIGALVQRARQGGSYHVSVSLTRTAMWCQSLGLFDKNEVEEVVWDPMCPLPPSIVTQTPLGTLQRLAPCVRFSETPGYWNEPVLVPRGSSRPVWLDREA
jgi:crotonobetainyl-CoA:carnitine CoA-transferase CaiB-like acyl-CoA transferase